MESLQWAFDVQDRFSGPIAKMQLQVERLEKTVKKTTKNSEDVFAAAAQRMQRETEKAQAAATKATERHAKARAQAEIREHERVAKERKKMLKEAGGAIGGALGGAFGGRGGSEIGAIIGGFSGGGFGGGAALGIGAAVVTTLIESIKRLFESVFDATKEISLQVLEHIRDIDATKFTLKQQLDRSALEELERFNSNRDVLSSFGNNLHVLEEMEKKLAFATGGKLPVESLERTVQVINEMNSIKGGGTAGLEEMTQMLAKFAATGKIRPGKFFMDFFGGEDAVASMFGIKGGQAEVRKKLEKMFTSGEIGFEDFINRTSQALAKRAGGSVGSTAVKRATETIGGAWERLVNLPQLWAQKMESNGAADRIIALINKVFDALDPDGKTGQKLYAAFEGVIDKTIGIIDKFASNPENIDRLVSAFSDAVAIIPKLIDALRALVEFATKAYNVIKNKHEVDRADIESDPTWKLKAAITMPGAPDEVRQIAMEELRRRGEIPRTPKSIGAVGGKAVTTGDVHIHVGEGQDAHEAGKQAAESFVLHLERLGTQ